MRIRFRNLSALICICTGAAALLLTLAAGASPLTAVTFVQQQKLQASNPGATDLFGHSSSLSGDTAVVGAYQDDNSGGADAGSAYVFTRSGGAWTEQQRLQAADAAAGDYFGFSVAVDGDTIIVGALRDKNVAGQAAGSAYVFTRSGGVWTQQQRLQPSAVALNDGFGYYVSLSGDTALVTSVADDDGGQQAGSAYVFTRSNGVWTQQQRIQASDRKEGSNFGHSAALEGDSLIIGAWQDDNGIWNAAGAAYVFVRLGGVWTQQQKLTGSDLSSLHFFGVSVALDGDTAIVGAHDNGSGAAYVFTRSGGVWTQRQRLQPPDLDSDAIFGGRVSLDGDTALISAPYDNHGVTPGTAYVFTRSGDVWTERQKFTAPDGAAGDSFGISLALSGDTVVVGAYQDDENGNADAGSAYVFVVEPVNAAPAVNAGPDRTAVEDAAFHLAASFTEADAADTHTATVDWGDGSPVEAAAVVEPSETNPGVVNATHTYLAPGTYTITVTVRDSDGASGSDSLVVTVGQCSPTNVALSSAGATATASSTYPGPPPDFAPGGAFDGDRKGLNWGAGGGWNDATRDVGPDWLQVEFPGPRRISEVRVFTLQDAFNSPVEPTPSTRMSLYGLKDYEVQYWDGAAWVTAGGVTNNVLVWRTFSFPAVVTTKVRVFVPAGGARAYFSRITELEVMGCAAP